MLALNYKKNINGYFHIACILQLSKELNILILASCFFKSAFKEAKRDKAQLRFCVGLLPTSDNRFSDIQRYSD